MSAAAASLGYAARGWSVIPLAPGGKAPLGRLVPHGVHNATLDTTKIEFWFEEVPEANVGIATGAVSGLVVLDIDMPDGSESLAKLCARNGSLPSGPVVATASGGRHHYFAHSGGTVANSVGRLGRNLDLRADGGHVGAPPSRTADGRCWSWLTPPDEPLNRAPDWICFPTTVVARLQAPLRRAACINSSKGYGTAALGGEAERVSQAREGTRNDTLHRAAFRMGQLVRTEDLDAAEAMSALLGAALASGLPESEVRRTLASGFKAGYDRPRGAGR
jgi:hypothetical protein